MSNIANLNSAVQNVYEKLDKFREEYHVCAELEFMVNGGTFIVDGTPKYWTEEMHEQFCELFDIKLIHVRYITNITASGKSFKIRWAYKHPPWESMAMNYDIIVNQFEDMNAELTDNTKSHTAELRKEIADINNKYTKLVSEKETTDGRILFIVKNAMDELGKIKDGLE